MHVHKSIPADRPGIIHWFHGNSGAGKTHLATHYDILNPNRVILDGDDVREMFGDSDMSAEGRWNQNIRLAKMAQMLSIQGKNVSVASICPYAKLRKEIMKIIPRVVWVRIMGPDSKPNSEQFPFEDGGYERG